MVYSSDSDDPTTSAKQRKKKKRLSRKKRLKMQANENLQTESPKTVRSKIAKLTKRTFSPKSGDRTKNKSAVRVENKNVAKKYGLTALKTKPKSQELSENGTKSPKKGFQKVKDILKKRPESMDQQSEQIKKLQQKLNSAKFRYLNEKLYKESGDKSFNYFQSDQESFKVYHEGFQDQVQKWPINPLDKIVEYVRQSPRTAKIVDFGCGEALLAQSVRQEVASFDLVALNKHVTACEMSRVPLKIASMDIAVFCLSLMGTNMSDYIIEAGRVLKNKGIMLIAEVSSRFDNPLSFVQEVEKLGFCHLSTTNFKMFVIMKFIRDSSKTKMKKSSVDLKLKPCVYKKR